MTFTGAVTTTGTSQAIRLEKALFRAMPELRPQARVKAHVIGPGQLLISLEPAPGAPAEQDPALAAFLAFLEKDMLSHPRRIVPLSKKSLKRAAELTKRAHVSDDEEIPDSVTL